MRCIASKREKELGKIVDPYFVCEKGGYLRPDAPDYVKAAYEELLEITARERETLAQDL